MVLLLDISHLLWFKSEQSERVGFEPTVPNNGYASLAGTCLRPLSHLPKESFSSFLVYLFLVV